MQFSGITLSGVTFNLNAPIPTLSGTATYTIGVGGSGGLVYRTWSM